MSNVKKMMGKKTTNLTEHAIASNGLAAKAAASAAYLDATLVASTPELKQLFSANLTQVIAEHTALSGLSINKGWVTPYESPEKLLLQTVNHSNDVLDNPIVD